MDSEGCSRVVMARSRGSMCDDRCLVDFTLGEETGFSVSYLDAMYHVTMVW